ncbi:FKBP-type peptidyl-prolyl cis-trans isomerase [[Eubacterium] cellulosolvens]
MSSKNGDKITIHFTVKTEDGQIVESSNENEPQTFQVGDRNLLPGLNKALLGLKKGDKKTITIPPNQGFGERKEDLLREASKTIIKGDVKGTEGEVVELSSKDGERYLATIQEVKKDTIVLDLNHPLAGETLTFEIQVVDIK